MVFSKSFPKEVEGYTKWVEVKLTDAEEKEQEALCRNYNINLMKECLSDAKELMKETDMKSYQTDLVRIAVSLFEKRSSHEIYWKEKKAREKFDGN